MIKNLVKEEDFDSFLHDNWNKLVLVKFSTVWCPPCQDLQNNIQKLLTELKQSVEKSKDLVVLKVDAEKFPRLVSQDLNLVLNVKSVPTFFLFYQGKMVKDGHGSRSVQQLREFIGV